MPHWYCSLLRLAVTHWWVKRKAPWYWSMMSYWSELSRVETWDLTTTNRVLCHLFSQWPWLFSVLTHEGIIKMFFFFYIYAYNVCHESFWRSLSTVPTCPDWITSNDRYLLHDSTSSVWHCTLSAFLCFLIITWNWNLKMENRSWM